MSPSSAPALESSSSPACLPRWPPPLERDAHISFLVRALDGLSSSYASLDASRPWLLYWTLHSLDLLGARPVDRFPGVVRFLARCQCPGGGFGGGPGQAPHTAATYAAVLALAIVGGREALGIIDTRGLRALYASLKEVDTGGFRVAPGGEADVRGAYTVLAVASLTGLLEEAGEEGGGAAGGREVGAADARAAAVGGDAPAASPSGGGLARGVAAFLLRCQSYEGGFGGEPGNEAHGGYTFCAAAGLALLRALPTADLPLLARWVARRQLRAEGGMAGRTHKLVDSCYSFWLGAVARILAQAAPAAPAIIDWRRLQAYLLACCQAPGGGMRDKPGKPRDLYHTCYALSGLALAQQAAGARAGEAGTPGEIALAQTHPLYNIRTQHVLEAHAFFRERKLGSD